MRGERRFTVRLTLEAHADPAGWRDGPYRLKLALKRLWRDLGFRCIELAEVKPEQERTPGERSPPVRGETCGAASPQTSARPAAMPADDQVAPVPRPAGPSGGSSRLVRSVRRIAACDG